MSFGHLRTLAFGRNNYRRWRIPKRGGGERTITAPRERLKAAQREVLDAIRLPWNGAAHGFLRRRSIVSNARVHAGAHLLVKLDVKDFFPSVTLPRVQGLYRSLGLGPDARVLAHLATAVPAPGEARALPQGAPTSPAITNALCRRLDGRLAGLARRFGFRFTRYADDVTFSWRPWSEGQKPPGNRLAAALVRLAARILRDEGFAVHPGKTEIVRLGRRLEVTGLVVNAAPGAAAVRVPREVHCRLRAGIHNHKSGRGAQETLEQLEGMAAHVYSTDPIRGGKYLKAIRELKEKRP